MKLPDFVVNVGFADGKYHAFYCDPIELDMVIGPARDTAEEAQADGMEALAMFAKLATANGLTVGDGKKH